MWISMKEMADLSAKRGHAIGAFHAVNLEQVQGVLEAAVEEQVPVIICLSEPASMYAGLGAFLAMTQELARDVPTPASLLLDHINDLDLISNGLAFGYTGVLADIRESSAADTVRTLTEIKAACVEQGAFFEVGLSMQGDKSSLSAEYAPKVLREVDPDSICLSINKKHRTNPSEEVQKNLAAIVGSIDCRLSLAGIGRWEASQLKNAISMGVWKISVATRINVAFTRGLKKFAEDQPGRINPRSYLAAARDAYREEVKQCIRLFASV